MNRIEDLAARQALLDTILQRAADRLGDVTPLVYERLFARFPEAPQTFETLYPGGARALQGEMVEQTLYCLMEWLASPGEIEIVLLGTVPHHADTLNVSPALFGALLSEVVAVVGETIPAGAADELQLWQDIHRDLSAVIDDAAQWVRRAPA